MIYDENKFNSITANVAKSEKNGIRILSTASEDECQVIMRKTCPLSMVSNVLGKIHTPWALM
jgi:hypothetical protein